MAGKSLKVDTAEVNELLKSLILPEQGFVRIAIAYSLAIGILTLAVPISVQTLINTVVNIASVSAVITLSLLLFVTLFVSSFFSAMRTYVMERFERHLYARLSGEISVRSMLTIPEHFAGKRNTNITDRYFDINVFRKNLPPLVVDGFALFLQTLVGLTLVSLYHPLFFIMSLLLVMFVYVIWRVWGKGAIVTAVEMSHAKYATAKWLSDVALSHQIIRGEDNIKFVRDKTEEKTGYFVDRHIAHFRYTFAQTIAFLLLYAVASSALLGMGGLLVIQGELSIGQLVAAELILTGIFFGISKAAYYLKLYYEMCGAADELGMVFKLPLEQEATGTLTLMPSDTRLSLHQLVCDKSHGLSINTVFEPGNRTLILDMPEANREALISVLSGQEASISGWFRFGDKDSRDLTRCALRQAVFIIDDDTIFECSVYEFFKLNNAEVTISQIEDALTRFDLRDCISDLPGDLDASLSVTGWPLSRAEFIRLKLAVATTSKVNLIILTPTFDQLHITKRVSAIQALESSHATILYFSDDERLGVIGTMPPSWQHKNFEKLLAATE